MIELSMTINAFWSKLIDEPIRFEKLKIGYGVEEESLENLEMVCALTFEPLDWSYDYVLIGTYAKTF